MSEHREALFMHIRMKLRQYSNEVRELSAQEEEGDITINELEKALIQLDDVYAEKIMDAIPTKVKKEDTDV